MGIFSKKKNKSPEQANPYAAPLTPYQQARAQLAQDPRPGPSLRESSFSNPPVGSFPPSNPPPPYNQSPSVGSSNSRFGDEKYGNQNGYGSTPYDNNNNAPAFRANGRGPGGYGGLEEDVGKNDLFGNAADRYVPQQEGNANGLSQSKPSSNRADNDPAKSALLGNAQDRYNPLPQAGSGGTADDEFDGYGAPRPLTEEEREEQDVQAIKDETSLIRKEGVASINRTVAIARATVNTGMSTYTRVGDQEDRLRRTERNLDAAAAKSRLAEAKTRELKKANGMFGFGNPLTTNRRVREADEAMMEQHRMERNIRETTRKDAYRSNQEIEETFKDIAYDRPGRKKPMKLLGQGEKKDYGFENTPEDDEDERRIEQGLDETETLVADMHDIALGIGSRMKSQITLLDRLAEKSDAVDDHVRMNREKLSRIH